MATSLDPHGFPVATTQQTAQQTAQQPSQAPPATTTTATNFQPPTPPPIPTLPGVTAPAPVSVGPDRPAPAQLPAVPNPTYQTYDFSNLGMNQGWMNQAASGYQQVANQPYNTAGIKEGQKETLDQLRQDQLSAIRANAARRGTLDSGMTYGLENLIGDQFAGNLTKAYRDTDIAGQDREIANRLAASQGLGGLANIQGQFDLTKAGLGSAENARQNAFNQWGAQFQSGQNQFNSQQALDVWRALLGQDVARAGIGLQNNAQNLQSQQMDINRILAQYGMTSTSRQQSLAELLGTQNLNLAGLAQNLNDWSARANNGIQAGQLAAQNRGLDIQQMLGLGNLGLGWGQLGQQASQFGQTMDWNQQQAFMNSLLGLMR